MYKKRDQVITALAIIFSDIFLFEKMAPRSDKENNTRYRHNPFKNHMKNMEYQQFDLWVCDSIWSKMVVIWWEKKW